MKKEVFLISWHSVICEITNSSTELFMLDTDKAVDLVRELVKEKEKEFPPEYGHYISVDEANAYYINHAFGCYDDDEIIAYLKAKGYTIEPPKDNQKSKYISVSAERGGMHHKLQEFIRETFNVIYYDTEA